MLPYYFMCMRGMLLFSCPVFTSFTSSNLSAGGHCPTLALIWLCLRMANRWHYSLASNSPFPSSLLKEVVRLASGNFIMSSSKSFFYVLSSFLIFFPCILFLWNSKLTLFSFLCDVIPFVRQEEIKPSWLEEGVIHIRKYNEE